MASFTSPDGVRLCYESHGAGPPVVLHLGAGCDFGLWDQAGYLEPLSREFRCLLFDHRGHGESDHPRGAAANHIDRFCDDVVALLDHLEVGSASFWGYSNGVSVGLRVAERHPSRLRALIGSGGVGRVPPGYFEERMPLRIAEFRAHGWEKLIGRFDEQEPEGVPGWMKERIRATDIQTFIDWLEAFPEWGDEEWDALPRIEVPTLFIVGELEDPEDETGEGAAMMPKASRIRVAGQGHIGAFIRSQLTMADAIAFLREYGADRGMTAQRKGVHSRPRS